MFDWGDLVSGLGPSAILAWYLWYSTTRLLPNILERHRTERKANSALWNQVYEAIAVQCLLIARQDDGLHNTYILLIEDSPIDARIIEQHIRDAGVSFPIASAGTVSAGIRKMPDAALLVIDVVLPDSHEPKTAALLARVEGVPACICTTEENVDQFNGSLQAQNVPVFDKSKDMGMMACWVKQQMEAR